MRRSLLLAATLLAAHACATNPATGRRELSFLSEEKEIALGLQSDGEVRKEMGVYADSALQDHVSDVGLRLAQQSERPNLPWHFTVVDVPAINAFAVPGGYIYITRGILPFLGDESQLASVLGHEIGHVTARHAAQQYTRSTTAGLGLILGSIFVPQARPLAQLGETGLGALFLKYSRGDELQADELGVRYVARAGWDPEGLPRMLTTLGRIEEASDNKGVPNWLSTHPAAENRVQNVQSAVRQAERADTSFMTDRDGYLRRIAGIVYGDNPEQGVVRGNVFLHPALRFAIEFPQGWDVNNGQTQVVAKEPGVDAFLALQQLQRPAGRNVEEAASIAMARAGFRPIDGSRTTINGLDAFVATYEGTLTDLGRVRIRGAYIRQDGNVFMVLGVAPIQAYDRFEREFSRTIRSFRPMARGEAEGVRPNRIELYTARAGDTWQSIADRQGKGTVKASVLSIMNGHALDDQPRPGERLKIVVAG